MLILHMRLDRLLIRRGQHRCKEVADLLASGRVKVDEAVERNGLTEIGVFTKVELDDEVLQNREALYLILHKPAGYLSATKDDEHPTVIDLIDHPLKHELHLAGRLDRASTGLVILSNDGRWTKRITEPVEEIPKVYRVTTRDAISPQTAEAFQKGIYFAYENLTTRAAILEILGSHEALLTLHEGRYHQVKRMFHAVGNQVTRLHRERIGPLALDETLPPGKYRHLTQAEIEHFGS